MDHTRVPNAGTKGFRKISCTKRTKGLKKKASELATLCDVDVCMICYDPEGNKPNTWPENPSSLRRIISRYLDLGKDEQDKEKLHLDWFLCEKKKKLEDDLVRLHKEDAHAHLSDCSKELLGEVAINLDKKLEIVRRKIDLLKAERSAKERLDEPTSNLSHLAYGFMQPCDGIVLDPGLTTPTTSVGNAGFSSSKHPWSHSWFDTGCGVLNREHDCMYKEIAYNCMHNHHVYGFPPPGPGLALHQLPREFLRHQMPGPATNKD